MGSHGVSADARRSVRRHQLRIRTVAVSFAAAAASARREMLVTDEERERLIDSWRSWTLETLRGYADEVRELRDGTSPDELEPLQRLDDELIRAYEIVRDA